MSATVSVRDCRYRGQNLALADMVGRLATPSPLHALDDRAARL